MKKLKEKVSDIVHQEDKTKQAKLKYVKNSKKFIKITMRLSYKDQLNIEFLVSVKHENSKMQFIWHMKWKNLKLNQVCSN